MCKSTKHHENHSKLSQSNEAGFQSEDHLSVVFDEDALGCPPQHSLLCASSADLIATSSARLTITLSTPVQVLSVFSPTSTTTRARVRKSLRINKGKCLEETTLDAIFPLRQAITMGAVTDRRDQCATITKFLSLGLKSFVNLVSDRRPPADSCTSPTNLSLPHRRDKMCR